MKSIFRHISIPNPDDAETNSLGDDRCIIRNTHIGVSDGAGGTGIYCGEWASCLLNAMPPVELSSFDNWMNILQGCVPKYVEEIEQKIQGDSFKLNKFYLEGSSATLVIAWLSNEFVMVMAYGDSQMMYVEKESMRLISFPNQNASDLSSQTDLITTSSIPVAENLKFIKVSKTEIHRLILCTDAVAKVILEYNEKYPSKIERLLIKLYNRCKISEKDDFLSLLNSNDIESDDYTLIISKKHPW